jgi:nucleoside-diphosphate-sugar epimerase
LNKTIFITGASGFVGSNIISNLTEYIFRKYDRTENIEIMEDIVLHLAGKAHDLKQISNSNEYYEVNTELTKKIFDAFLTSKAKVFITISSVKAIADSIDTELTENHIPIPITHYGKSKLQAEQYILSKKVPIGKRVFILRPCMIHGQGNKGNLNLLFKVVKLGLPWPLGSFKNKRSYCSIDNLCFIINELILNENIPTNIFNIADDSSISTNEIIELMSKQLGKKHNIWNISKILIIYIAKIGDYLYLPLNINKPLPYSITQGLIKTLQSF